MIASFVAIMPTRPAQPQTPAAERLIEMLVVRRQLSAEKVAENASRLLEDAMLRRLSHRRIARLTADIEPIIGTDDPQLLVNFCPRLKIKLKIFSARKKELGLAKARNDL